MDVTDKFFASAALICEPARAAMLWSLLDGKAYTAGELASSSGISATAASNHLARLLSAGFLKVEKQGRHRYYSFSRPEVAYVIESIANLSGDEKPVKPEQQRNPVKYCRSCYDHLAGQVGVLVTEQMERKGFIRKSTGMYMVPPRGWKFFETIGIEKDALTALRRPLTRQCLDWSERRPHLAGALGAALLEKMMSGGWFRKTRFSRELVLTSRGRQQLLVHFGLQL